MRDGERHSSSSYVISYNFTSTVEVYMVWRSLTTVHTMLEGGISRLFRLYGVKFELRAMKPTHAVSHKLHGNILPHCFYHQFRTDKTLPNCFAMNTRKHNTKSVRTHYTLQEYCAIITCLPCRIHVGHCSGFSF
jgi:hypothetical protein